MSWKQDSRQTANAVEYFQNSFPAFWFPHKQKILCIETGLVYLDRNSVHLKKQHINFYEHGWLVKLEENDQFYIESEIFHSSCDEKLPPHSVDYFHINSQFFQ